MNARRFVHHSQPTVAKTVLHAYGRCNQNLKYHKFWRHNQNKNPKTQARQHLSDAVTVNE